MKSFNLLRWFSLASLVCIVLLSGTMAMLLSRFMTKTMIERDAAISSQFVESFANAKSVSTYFEGLQDMPPDPALISFFESFFEHFLLESDVIRANVYARDETIVWSSTRDLIGKRFGPNDGLDSALGGHVIVELGTVGIDDKTEHIEFEPELKGQRYIETYMPIWSGDRRTIIGVVEIYRLTKEMFQAIDTGVRFIWVGTTIGGILLYIALFAVVRQAGIVIRRQEQRLVELESMATIGEMASAVAHGIRNPLASIRSSAEVATIQNLDGAHRAAKEIITNVDRLSEWIRSFLYQAHGDSPATAAADVNAIARSNLDGLAAVIRRQNVELTQDMQESLPLVRVDSALLGHALNSLLTNALEAMPAGGKLHITTRMNTKRRVVEVHIADSGHGLAKHLTERVFRPFTTTKRGGLGLGLALSRRAIERSGGTIDLTSVSGEGLVVVIQIPTVD